MIKLSTEDLALVELFNRNLEKISQILHDRQTVETFKHEVQITPESSQSVDPEGTMTINSTSCDKPAYSTSFTDDISSPLISCWSYCPLFKERTADEMLNYSSYDFVSHLNEHHRENQPLDMADQQLVCCCSNCVSVVTYTPESKASHFHNKCNVSDKVNHYYIFIEDNKPDMFQVGNLNAPTTTAPSPGTQLSPVVQHSVLDTLVWKNNKGGVYFYHYCCNCHIFIADTDQAVEQHTLHHR